LVKLFQKLAEHETASRLNARASALAGVLQKAEALLLLFGQSRCFPNVGKCISDGFPNENEGVSQEAELQLAEGKYSRSVTLFCLSRFTLNFLHHL
jgi:hypothetical protein